MNKNVDVSQATLDVIEAVKNNKTIKFDYKYKHGVNDEPKTYIITPSGFFNDFIGFEGVDEDDYQQFKRFRFDNVTDWIGITKPVKVLIELEFNGYPTDKEVELELHKLVDSREPVMWRVEDD
jgi:predicted DNA-binding transcriptional regulator YafY